MKAVLLDAVTLGADIDLTPIRNVASELRVFQQTTPEQLFEYMADADLILTNNVVISAAGMAGRKAIHLTAQNIIQLVA